MAVVSDTNILSSFAAADGLLYLFKLFPNEILYIPPAVELELHAALSHGKSHVQLVFGAIHQGAIQVLPLTRSELALTTTLPGKLHAGEREALILCQSRQHQFISNDRKAVNYGRAVGIKVMNLETLLRLLWLHHYMSQNEVKRFIQVMATAEELSLKPEQLATIFAPRRR